MGQWYVKCSTWLMMLLPVLHDFRVLRPAFSSFQEHSLRWLHAAHARADLTQGHPDRSDQHLKILRRVGCSPEQIERRGHELSDFNHQDWSEMKVFRLTESPAGVSTEKRTLLFGEAANRVFERFYEEDTRAPNDLIHVTCTGYLSPSSAQRLVVKKGWGAKTEVTHAYHMGCYASFPAIRQARGFLGFDSSKHRVDIVHTELCSLHLDPSNHTLENFVIQSLFADGFVRYSLSPVLPSTSRAGFEILALHETLIPGTEEAMTWVCGDAGMKMTLSKDVPGLIASHLEEFIRSFLAPTGLSLHEISKEARFAIHPGGPKILDQVQVSLGLRSEQIQASRAVLKECGNMSSATLPHIWERMVNDPSVPVGSKVLSLAFGPGLALCGALLRKVGSAA